MSRGLVFWACILFLEHFITLHPEDHSNDTAPHKCVHRQKDKNRMLVADWLVELCGKYSFQNPKDFKLTGALSLKIFCTRKGVLAWSRLIIAGLFATSHIITNRKVFDNQTLLLSLPGFVYQRQAVPRRTISLRTCVWRWTESPAPCRWVLDRQPPLSMYPVHCTPSCVSHMQFGDWLIVCILCLLQGYLPPTKNGVEPKRPSRPINITSLVRLSTTVPNTIVVSWTSEIGRVRRHKLKALIQTTAARRVCLCVRNMRVEATQVMHCCPFCVSSSEFLHGCVFGSTADVHCVVAKTTGQRNQEPWPLQGSKYVV